MYRTNTCGELRLSDAGKEVTLAGWVQRARKMGGMTFVDLRDRYGITQLVFNEADNADLCGEANKLGREYCIQVKGVLRGLHYQEGDTAQAKLVRVIKGKVVDVAVDLRKSSPTFGKYVMVELSEDNKRQFFVPRGFAHGFLVLSDEAVFTYKVDNVYSPKTEASIKWNDETVGITWPIDAKDVILSDKDLNKGLALKEAKVFE